MDIYKELLSLKEHFPLLEFQEQWQHQAQFHVKQR